MKLAPDSTNFKYDPQGILLNRAGQNVIHVNTDVKAIKFPEGVMYVGIDTLHNCRKLRLIGLPDSLMSKKSQFEYLRNVKVVPAKSFDSAVNDSTFQNFDAPALPAYSDAGNNEVGNFVLSSDGTVLKKCLNKNIEHAVIPERVVVIGKNAFQGCSGLKSIIIPEGVISIGDSAFLYCRNLESVKLPDSLVEIGKNAFHACRKLKLVLPTNVSKIGSSAFGNVAEITLAPGQHCLKMDSQGVLFSGDGTILYSATRPLFTYAVPKGVQKIEDSAFHMQQHLEKITLPSTLTTIGNAAFAFTKFKNLIIPDNVTDIGWDAFWNNNQVSVYISANVRNIKKAALSQVREVILSPGNRYFKTDRYGAVISRDNTRIISIPRNLRNYVIPEGVIDVDFNFYGCNELNLTIPASVKKIYSLEVLKSVKVDPDNTRFKYDPQGILLSRDGTQIYNIDKDVTMLRIPRSVKFISRTGFRNCSSLRYLYLPEHLRSKLKNVQIPKKVKVIFW